MGSADISGVNDRGFLGAAAAIRPASLGSAHPFTRTALVASAFLGAVAFTAYEVYHTIAGLQERFELAASPVPHAELLAALLSKLGFALTLVLLAVLISARRSSGTAPGSAQASLAEPALEAVPYGLARWTADGRLLYANAAFARLLRLDAAAVAVGTGYALVSGALAGRITARPVIETECRRLVELARADGTVVTLDERPCPGGGFVTIVADATERKAADRMLSAVRDEQRRLAERYHEEKIRAQAASRAKSAFLAHLSHDIRTPLNHIIGFADLMRLEAFGPLGDDNYRAYLTDIKEAGEKLLDRFAQILEFAELESGCKSLACEPVELGAFFSATRARYARRAAEAGVRFHIAPRVPGEIRGDRHYLDRMLGNLIENAIRHTPRGGEIRMAGWLAEDGIVIEITDTGAGMPPETLSQLSQPFVSADAHETRTHEGAGLGIAMARTIAELSGGRLAIDSMQGVGTTVAICLPLHAQSDPARIERQAA